MRLAAICLFVFALLNFPQPQVGQTVGQTLPSGVLKALAADEREYCERFLGSYKKGCGDTFRANLGWRELEITPAGQTAILVENKTSCGIAGCALYVFVQKKSGNFTQVLGADGGLGTLKRVAVLKKITNGHYDIRITWSDGKSYSDYSWDGWHYSTDDRDFWGTGSKMSDYPTNRALEPVCRDSYIAAMSQTSLRSLSTVFFRYGNTTFGGGSATIATLHQQIVTKRGWVTQQQFDLSYALSRLTPGTNLLAFSTAIGWLIRGWSGALVVLLASSIPCSILAVLLTAVYESLARNSLAMTALRGALAAAVGIIAATAWTLIRPHVKDTSKLNIAAFSIGAFLLAAVFHFPPIRILVAAGFIGIVLPQKKSV